jgi:hypothetical protein
MQGNNVRNQLHENRRYQTALFTAETIADALASFSTLRQAIV